MEDFLGFSASTAVPVPSGENRESTERKRERSRNAGWTRAPIKNKGFVRQTLP